MFKGRRFSDERVILDGARFDDCTFDGTTLLFFGGAVPEIRNCRFLKVRFAMEGPAKNTVELLRRLNDHQVSLE